MYARRHVGPRRAPRTRPSALSGSARLSLTLLAHSATANCAGARRVWGGRAGQPSTEVVPEAYFWLHLGSGPTPRYSYALSRPTGQRMQLYAALHEIHGTFRQATNSTHVPTTATPPATVYERRHCASIEPSSSHIDARQHGSMRSRVNACDFHRMCLLHRLHAAPPEAAAMRSRASLARRALYATRAVSMAAPGAGWK